MKKLMKIGCNLMKNKATARSFTENNKSL